MALAQPRTAPLPDSVGSVGVHPIIARHVGLESPAAPSAPHRIASHPRPADTRNAVEAELCDSLGQTR